MTFAGDVDKLAFNSSVSGNTVTIEAKPRGDLWVSKGVSVTSGATMTKSSGEDGSLTVNLSNITTNTTVTFSGFTITYTGDRAGILISSSISEEGNVAIFASCRYSYDRPNTVSTNSGILSQSTHSRIRLAYSICFAVPLLIGPTVISSAYASAIRF